MNQEYKKLIIFFAKAVVIILAADFALGSVLDFVYGKMKSGERARAHYAITQSKADLYIFGDSRAFAHYDPAVLSDSLHLAVYNAGRPAQSILYQTVVLKMILKRTVPKYVILDLNERELLYTAGKYEILGSLLPYYNKDEDVKMAINKYRPSYYWFSWSHTLPYNSSAFAILTRTFGKPKEIDKNGFIPYRGCRVCLEGKAKEEYNCPQDLVYDDNLSEAIKEFVKICRDHKIQLFTVISPRFEDYRCERQDVKKLKTLLSGLGVTLWIFSDDRRYLDNGHLMFDLAHLNEEGAKKFSSQLAEKINDFLKNEGKNGDGE